MPPPHCILNPFIILPVILTLMFVLRASRIVESADSKVLSGVVTITTLPTSALKPRPTITPRPTATPSATPTTTPSSTYTPSATTTPSSTHTLSPTATAFKTATFAGAASRTPSPTPSPSATVTPSSTFTPQPTPLAQAAEITSTVPILMYHYLSIPPDDADVYRLDLSVTPENFEEQLAYLKDSGYTSVSMDDLVYHLAGHRDLPDKPVIITFDDGYVDNYLNAFPLLKKYGFTALFSLVTQPIDQGSERYMSWDNVKEMHAEGMDFGAHTYRHFDLRDSDVDFLVYEIVGSKEAIEARTKEPVRIFVYPSGKYDQKVIDVVASANFWAALTTEYGNEHTYQNRFELTRVRVRGSDTLEDFINKLEN